MIIKKPQNTNDITLRVYISSVASPLLKHCQSLPAHGGDHLWSNNNTGPHTSMNHIWIIALRWHHNKHDGISNHQPHNCLLNCLFRRRSKKTSKLRVSRLCEGNSLVTGEFPAQRSSNAENVSIWWCHHGLPVSVSMCLPIVIDCL